ncbi:hypothetical protein [Rhizobium gallicum]|uniref:hypothetical protein n=1 Tax=Rhizobium gallicum TaxID=56730 RepID=UPI001EF8BE18|nr:hypothetical protein [Rhizobium gallicum]ULJ74398.1 hypothetical protein L2W42_21185 [Rhizobium gallicum]
MEDLYLTAETDHGSELCLSPLTDRQIAMSGQELSDTGGYFLFERVGSGDHAWINIIARLTSEDAVDRMRLMLSLR